MTRKNIWRLGKVYGRITGYPELRPRDLRHRVAMELLAQNHDLEEHKHQAVATQARGRVLRKQGDEDGARVTMWARSGSTKIPMFPNPARGTLDNSKSGPNGIRTRVMVAPCFRQRIREL